MKSLPVTRRAAKRSLMFEDTPEGRVIVGSMWMPRRIIANTKAHATAAALEWWVKAQRGAGK